MFYIQNLRIISESGQGRGQIFPLVTSRFNKKGSVTLPRTLGEGLRLDVKLVFLSVSALYLILCADVWGLRYASSRTGEVVIGRILEDFFRNS